MMQQMCGVSLKKHLSNEALRGRLGIDCVSDLVRCSKLRWLGHGSCCKERRPTMGKRNL